MKYVTDKIFGRTLYIMKIKEKFQALFRGRFYFCKCCTHFLFYNPPDHLCRNTNFFSEDNPRFIKMAQTGMILELARRGRKIVHFSD